MCSYSASDCKLAPRFYHNVNLAICRKTRDIRWTYIMSVLQIASSLTNMIYEHIGKLRWAPVRPHILKWPPMLVSIGVPTLQFQKAQALLEKVPKWNAFTGESLYFTGISRRDPTFPCHPFPRMVMNFDKFPKFEVGLKEESRLKFMAC